MTLLYLLLVSLLMLPAPLLMMACIVSDRRRQCVSFLPHPVLGSIAGLWLLAWVMTVWHIVT